jgi:hypothetical protein
MDGITPQTASATNKVKVKCFTDVGRSTTLKYHTLIKLGVAARIMFLSGLGAEIYPPPSVNHVTKFLGSTEG